MEAERVDEDTDTKIEEYEPVNEDEHFYKSRKKQLRRSKGSTILRRRWRITTGGELLRRITTVRQVQYTTSSNDTYGPEPVTSV